jgi:hypothetical protein
MKTPILNKFRFSLLMLLVSAASVIQAQNGKQSQNSKDKIESYRIAFITKRLNLTPEEAKVFWPVYNKYTEELETLRKNRVDFDNIDFTNLSAEDADKKGKEIFAFRQSELDLQKKYYSEFKKVIPAQKVLLLMKAENDFKRQLVRMLQEKNKPDDQRR